MSAFASWLMGFARVFLTWVYNYGIDLINAAIKGLCTFVVSLASLFPSANSSLTVGTLSGDATSSIFITSLNWLFPIAYLVTVVGVVVAAMVAYFAIAPLLRWFKVLT